MSPEVELRFYSVILLPVCFLCFVCEVEDVRLSFLSLPPCLLLTAMPPVMDSYPSRTYTKVNLLPEVASGLGVFSQTQKSK